jgi:23S rRNA (guanosine2251-2'-O)-methyltransferase
MSSERTPFQVTIASTAYEEIKTLPVTILLEDIRSLYNVGSFFRTADAAAIEKLVLSGITGRPPHKGILKTALGSEATVPWEYRKQSVAIAEELHAQGYEIAMMETTTHAVDLFDWTPRFPVCVIFGNEVDGVTAPLAALCDTHVRIPMLGMKHSLNVATAGGVVMYELLRKYRRIVENAITRR